MTVAVDLDTLNLAARVGLDGGTFFVVYINHQDGTVGLASSLDTAENDVERMAHVSELVRV